jgi:tetratricopeptide (TPR) repeat protein
MAAMALVAVVSTPAAAQEVSASAVAKLERERDRRPNDVRALRALGVAYYKNGRFQDARTVLARAVSADSRDGVSALYLGLSAERMNDLGAARLAYTSYLAVGRSGRAKNDVNARLAAIQRLELAAAARDAIAQEQQLAQRPGPPNTIAVLPFNFTGADAALAPLGRGLADLMVSDLSLVPTLTLLERTRVQVLIDEIQRGQSGRVDPATAARSGRMLQAGRLVLGSITQTPAGLNIVAPTYTVSGAQPQPGSAQAQVSGALSNIFQLQDDLVLEVLVDLGIPATPQQRAAILQRPTENLQAFLAYSRGLVASDAGRLEEAANFFDNARSLDPSFGAAAVRASEARAALQGQSVTPAAIEADLQGAERQVVSSAERGALANTRDMLGTTLSRAIADVNPSPADAIGRAVQTEATARDPVASTTGAEQAARTATIIIIIRRP